VRIVRLGVSTNATRNTQHATSNSRCGRRQLTFDTARWILSEDSKNGPDRLGRNKPQEKLVFDSHGKLVKLNAGFQEKKVPAFSI